jgi:hypothetical protein
MHLPINVKSPNNISKWQIGFNSAFKGLTLSNRIFFLFVLGGKEVGGLLVIILQF